MPNQYSRKYICRRERCVWQIPIYIIKRIEKEVELHPQLTATEIVIDALDKHIGSGKGVAAYSQQLENMQEQINELEGKLGPDRFTRQKRITEDIEREESEKLEATLKPKTHCYCGNPLDFAKYQSRTYCSEKCYLMDSARRSAVRLLQTMEVRVIR